MLTIIPLLKQQHIIFQHVYGKEVRFVPNFEPQVQPLGRGSRFVVSNPCWKKHRQGWGTRKFVAGQESIVVGCLR
jgi:hypothetical protein